MPIRAALLNHCMRLLPSRMVPRTGGLGRVSTTVGRNEGTLGTGIALSPPPRTAACKCTTSLLPANPPEQRFSLPRELRKPFKLRVLPCLHTGLDAGSGGAILDDHAEGLQLVTQVVRF